MPIHGIHVTVVHALARAFLAGEQTFEAVAARADAVLGRRWKWVRQAAQRYVAAYAGKTRPWSRDVAAFLERDAGFRRACAKHGGSLRVVQWTVDQAEMQPVAAAAAWDVPVIESVQMLAEWLRLSPAELEWFADLKTLGRRRGSSERVQHYHYRLFTKKTGSVRLIEAPKDGLKTRQRQILAEILERIPGHAAVHGFVRRRSIETFAAPHVRQDVLLRLDLRNFFPSIRRARVQSVFRTLGYPEAVADLLGGLCTNVVPSGVFRSLAREAQTEMRILYEQSHLPQGAPTSPALANLCGYRMDLRLEGLARAAGASYTRYADDLAFSGSGDFERGVKRFAAHVAAVVTEEGFAVNHRKTRMMRRSVRQHLAGLVVNERLSVSRVATDRLKAILTNCVRNGAEVENREGMPFWREHLLGKIGFVASVHGERGAHLRTIFDQIDWGGGSREPQAPR